MALRQACGEVAFTLQEVHKVNNNDRNNCNNASKTTFAQGEAPRRKILLEQLRALRDITHSLLYSAMSSWPWTSSLLSLCPRPFTSSSCISMSATCKGNVEAQEGQSFQVL